MWKINVKVRCNPKITRREDKKWINLQCRFPITSSFCNITGVRLGDKLKLSINNFNFESKVSDYVSIPPKLILKQNELDKVKDGKTVKKNIEIKVLNVEKIYPKFDMSNNFIGILSHLYSDGSISPTKIDYINTNSKSIKHFKELLQKFSGRVLFGQWLDGNVTHIQSQDFRLVSIISRYIENFGRKSVTNIHAPKFVINNKEFSREWLSHSFSDEGWFNDNKTIRLGRSVRFRNGTLLKTLRWKKTHILKDNYPIFQAKLDKSQLKFIPQNNILEDEKMMLQNMGIKSMIYPRRRVSRIGNTIEVNHELSVKIKDFIRIGFCSIEKQDQLIKRFEGLN